MPNYDQNTYTYTDVLRNINATHTVGTIDSVNTIITNGIECHVSEPMKDAIRELFDSWCSDIVDRKLDISAMNEVIPALNHCTHMIQHLEQQYKEYNSRILFLQTQLEELQEQLKYLGFERLLME